MKKEVRSYSGTTDAAVSDRELENRKTARKAAAEGIVLLENKNHFLPLKKSSNIALYGGGADKTIKGGTGSGDVNARDSVTIYQGLINAGFQVTTQDWIMDYNSAYEQARLDWKDSILSKGKDAGLVEFFDIYSTTPFEIPAGRPVSEQDVETQGQIRRFLLSAVWRVRGRTVTQSQEITICSERNGTIWTSCADIMSMYCWSLMQAVRWIFPLQMNMIHLRVLCTWFRPVWRAEMHWQTLS